MIAADTSSVVAYLKGESGDDVERLDEAAVSGDLALPPVVVTELFSDQMSGEWADRHIARFAVLTITAGFWQRAGETRRILAQHGLKAKVADALIAQSCIDNDVALITRDTDFRHFAKHCGLKLAQ
jgi:predicted nucleic acid-binding protein